MAAVYLQRQAIAPLEIISIKELFLGVASALLRFGCLEIQNIMLGHLVCKSSVSMGNLQ
jgi:hypothetical protein